MSKRGESLLNDLILPYTHADYVNIKHKKFNNKHLNSHWHQFFELELISAGTGIHKINDKVYPLRKGEMHLMKLTDIHEFSFEEECELYMIQFPAIYLSKNLNSLLLNTKKDLIVYFDESEYEYVKHLFDMLIVESQKKDAFDSVIKENIIGIIVMMLFRKLKIDKDDFLPVKDNRINNIIIYMQNNFNTPINIQEISEHFHMNSEYFSRYFKKNMKIGPKEYLKGLRMNYAKKLLLESQMKILDICMGSGYDSMATFLRDFKEKYKCTPKEMRNKTY